MHWLDYLTVGVYLAVILGIGFFHRRIQSRNEFFLASASMGSFVVGLSVMATLFSSLSFVFYPSAAYQDGLKIGLCLVSFTLMTVVVIRVFIPVYTRLKVATAYEFLERRYHVSVRTLASALFILLRIGWMASAAYAAALVISSVAQVDHHLVILVLGAVTICYTLLGGLRAVMWTDVVQFFIFTLTIIVSITLIMSKSGTGVGEMFRTYFDGRKGLVIDFDLSLTLAYGSWAILIGSFIEGLSAFGVDQVAVQRYLSAKTERHSQIGAAINLIGMWIVIPGLLMIGVALYGWYLAHPQELTGGADRALPDFVRLHFPPGLTGLFLSALIAAIMSSLDSGMHSVTTAVIVDFRDRLFPFKSPLSAGREVLYDRAVLCLVGSIGVGLAFLVGTLGDVFTIAKKLTSAFGGPLLAIFLLALFSRRSNWQGVLLGALPASAVTLFLMLTKTDWFAMWFWPLGFFLALVLGYGLSLFFPHRPTEYTYFQIIRNHKET